MSKTILITVLMIFGVEAFAGDSGAGMDGDEGELEVALTSSADDESLS